jgi:hypothetical protein
LSLALGVTRQRISHRPRRALVGDFARTDAAGFVESYGKSWESWDGEGFVELFSDDVSYVVHPTEEIVVGKDALRGYLEKEEAAQGAVSVQMGRPVIDGERVAAEFWVTASGDG